MAYSRGNDLVPVLVKRPFPKPGGGRSAAGGILWLPPAPAAAVVARGDGVLADLTEQLKSESRDALVQMAKDRGIDFSGKKSELVTRISLALRGVDFLPPSFKKEVTVNAGSQDAESRYEQGNGDLHRSVLNKARVRGGITIVDGRGRRFFSLSEAQAARKADAQEKLEADQAEQAKKDAEEELPDPPAPKKRKRKGPFSENQAEKKPE